MTAVGSGGPSAGRPGVDRTQRKTQRKEKNWRELREETITSLDQDFTVSSVCCIQVAPSLKTFDRIMIVSFGLWSLTTVQRLKHGPGHGTLIQNRDGHDVVTTKKSFPHV